MLFTDRDYNVFDDDESRQYFSEILQLYYCKNYRAAVVQLYSFLIYDLFMKLQTMANDGDKSAVNKIKEINTKIENDEHYSNVEKCILEYIVIGEINYKTLVLYVSYTERSDVIRLISARKATASERRKYYDSKERN